MDRKSFSFRTVIYYIIIVMGMLAIILTTLSVRWYRNIVLDEQRESMALLAKYAVDEQLRRHEAYLFDLGLTMQSDPDFLAAFVKRDITELEFLTKDQFHQYFTTTGLVDLKRIVLYDMQFKQILDARSEDAAELHGGICAPTLQSAKQREGVERLKTIAGLCQYEGHPYHMAFVPIGGLHLKGYAAIIVNPIYEFRYLDGVRGFPYTIALPSGETVFSSSGWNSGYNPNDFIVANYSLPSDQGDTLFVLSVRKGVTEINQKLLQLTINISLLAGLVTIFVVVFTMGLFKRTIIAPLNNLNSQMAKIRGNREALSEQVTISGCEELNTLAKEFNIMASELSQAQTELMHRAHTDELTGLANRFLFYERLESLVDINRCNGTRFTLLMTDLNDFKDVNDTLGHHAGDELLKQIADRLSKNLRRSDTIARLGGDEFALLLPTVTNMKDAEETCRKIITIIEEPYVIYGHTVTIGLSMGIAIFPDTAADSENLLHCADKSMYHAKLNQLGCYFCASPCDDGAKCHLERSRILECCSS